MGAGIYDFTIEQGATFIRTVRIAGISDVTGYTAKMDIRKAAGSSAALLQLTTENERIEIQQGEDEMQITLTVSAADTAALSFSSAVYDLVITSSAGVATRILQGAVLLAAGVTQ